MGPWVRRRDQGPGEDALLLAPAAGEGVPERRLTLARERERLDARVAVLVVSPRHGPVVHGFGKVARLRLQPPKHGLGYEAWLLRATKAIGRAPASSIAGSTTSFQVAASAATVGLSRELQKGTKTSFQSYATTCSCWP